MTAQISSLKGIGDEQIRLAEINDECFQVWIKKAGESDSTRVGVIPADCGLCALGPRSYRSDPVIRPPRRQMHLLLFSSSGCERQMMSDTITGAREMRCVRRCMR